MRRLSIYSTFIAPLNAVSVKDACILMNSLPDIAGKLWLPSAWKNFYIRCLGLFFQRGALAPADILEDLGSQLVAGSIACEILDGCRNTTSEESFLTWQKAAWCSRIAITTRTGVLITFFLQLGAHASVSKGSLVALSVVPLCGTFKGSVQVQVFIFPEHV